MEKSIIITGASSGIGEALAYEFAQKRYRLGLVARNIEKLEEIKRKIEQKNPGTRIAVAPMDVTKYDEIPGVFKHLIEKLERLDILFANAGIGLGEKIGHSQFEKAKKTIETNLIGAMATVDAGVEHFLKAGKGHIVGTCSVAAFRGFPRSSSYSASKAGFALYLESLRAETYRKNIDVTVLYPGYIDTPLNNMLPNRPFVISVERGAKIIAKLIEKKVKVSTVPKYPWNILGKVLKILPTPIISKM